MELPGRGRGRRCGGAGRRSVLGLVGLVENERLMPRLLDDGRGRAVFSAIGRDLKRDGSWCHVDSAAGCDGDDQSEDEVEKDNTTQEVVKRRCR